VKQVDAMALGLIAILVVIAFLNHGSLSLQGTPQGTSLGLGFGMAH
jgi:hypothetical protein